MKKILLFLILITVLHIKPTYAQQQYYNWQIGGGIGVMSYYGDLTYRLNTINISVPAYQFTIGRNISPSFALLLHTQLGQISGNDRARDWNGNLRTENPNFTRALNFQTDIRNTNLLLSYRLNNGKILSRYAAIGPYIYAGVGVTDFTVYGDLFNAQGQRYYYWSDNTIRSLPENPANAGQAQMVGQDGKFETQLSGLRTETAYPTTVLNIPVGAGIKFRISERLSANIQSTVNYAFKGYLDDVSGAYVNNYDNELQAYAANPSGIRREMRGNNRNDMFVSATVSLHYYFNMKRKKFEAPLVYTGYQQPKTVSSHTNTADTDANYPLEMQADTLQLVTAPQVKRQFNRQYTIKKVPPGSITKPDTDLRPSPDNRQTIDVKVRVFIERGDSVAYEVHNIQPYSNIKEQSLQTGSYLNGSDTLMTNLDTVGTNVPLRSVYNQFQINALRNELETLKREVQTYKTKGDTIGRKVMVDTLSRKPSAVPQQNIEPNTVRPPEQNKQRLIRQQAPQQTEWEAVLNRRIDSLTNVLGALKAQLQQNVRTDTSRNNDVVGQQQALPNNRERVQAQQYDYSQDINNLRSELNGLRSEMNRRRHSNANADRQNYQAPPPNPTAVVTVPNALSQNKYDAQEMNRLKNELSAIKQKLNNLQAQQKTNDNTQVSNQIDSLLNLVTAIDRAKQLNAQANNVDANTADINNDTPSNEQTMEALRSQIDSLNESLSAMQNQLTEIENVPPPAPLSDLGSTVVYYDINKSELKPEDKQRLAVLANRLKVDQYVLLNIKGYTDQTGNAAYNLMLSRKRAENIKRYFVSEIGVNPDQILVNYFGQQTTSGEAAKNNPYDRRVELQLFRENTGK